MSENSVFNQNNCWIITSDELRNNVNSDWFDDLYWLNQGRLLGASSGRGSAWMVKADNNKMMLRHYYRGGIPAKFNKDKYFWTGLKRTRSFSEFLLLEKMIKLKLPVPKPIAAQACKKGLFYQANILIKYIIHEATFAAILNTGTKVEIWQNIGETIANFHNHGINHADLNAHNILVAKEKIHLIDFDHSKQCTIRAMWQDANLKRLKRSIDKVTKSDYKLPNNEKWQSLLKAYNKTINR